MSVTAPLTLLIAALGGEGGGVLTGWIVAAARAGDLPVQATSIPGVAQRTGATTYYIEIWPEPWSALGGRTPVLALSPAPGEVDIMAATELLEAGRAIQTRCVTPDRTLLVGSTHRIYATAEKMAMGDGRYDSASLLRAIEQRSRAHILFDMEQAAREAGAVINAVMLGALAGGGGLPLADDALRQAIRDGGIAVEANLRGFELGLAAARGDAPPQSGPAAKRADPNMPAGDLLRRVEAEIPQAVQPTARHAVRRLVDYQDAAHAGLYLDRLAPFADAAPEVVAAMARNLAVRMSYEDIIRVAQVKVRPGRLARIRAETGAAPGEKVTVTEFFKPGFAEFRDIAPAFLADRLVALAERHPALGRWQWSMQLRSTSVGGHLRLRLLAGLRRWRRGTWRWREESRAIEDWLALAARAARADPALAVEIADCARLIRGYGDTHRRGQERYARIRQAVIEPALEAGHGAAAVAAARTAALADIDDTAFQATLASAAGELSAQAPRQAVRQAV